MTELGFIGDKIVKIYNKLERSLQKMPVWFHLLLLLIIIQDPYHLVKFVSSIYVSYF